MPGGAVVDSKYPRTSELCGFEIESVEDLEWHGFGNCIEITYEMLDEWGK